MLLAGREQLLSGCSGEKERTGVPYPLLNREEAIEGKHQARQSQLASTGGLPRYLGSQ